MSICLGARFVFKYEDDVDNEIKAIESGIVKCIVYDNECVGSCADIRIISTLVAKGLSIVGIKENGVGGYVLTFAKEGE